MLDFQLKYFIRDASAGSPQKPNTAGTIIIIA